MRKGKRFLISALILAFAFMLAACGSAPAGGSLNGSHGTVQTDTQISETVTAKSDEMNAYLFVHFIGSEGAYDAEQVYFSVSRDGLNWERLNDRQPILRSTVGEKGIRDPHIVRSPDGKKFYLIATDLSIHHGGLGWGDSQTKGSKYIVVWESEDLIEWSDARWCRIARDDAGCTWAPESIYDYEKKAYMVFWASKTPDSWTHRIYRCYTTDFIEFTEPELYIENEFQTIDTTFLYHDGVYYRFSKNETSKYVYMEKGTSLSGEFELVGTYSLDGGPAESLTGVEGATACKLNGEDKWCLFVDKHNNGGYLPYVTDDIASGRFVSGSDFYFGIHKWEGAADDMRHGVILPITQAEYDRLIGEWGLPEADEADEDEKKLIVSLDFEDSLSGTGIAESKNGDATYGDGVNGGKAIRLNNNYIQIVAGEDEDHPMSNLNTATVSFAVKRVGNSNGEANSTWLFYAAPDSGAQSYRNEHYIGALDYGNQLKFERYNAPEGGIDRTVAVSTGDMDNDYWKHITIVYDWYNDQPRTAVYVNGTLQGYRTYDSTLALDSILGDDPFVAFGYANWDGGQYSNVWLDGVRIYNYALTTQEVYRNYQTVMGK